MTLVGSKFVFILLIAMSMYLAVEGTSPITGETNVQAFRIDLQTAPVHELELLPGIGPKTARAIVDFRAEHEINTPDDLIGVYGIGNQTIEQLRFLTTEPSSTR